MAPTSQFSVREADKGCFFLDDGGRTVALVTSHGYIDWLLRAPDLPGPLLTEIRKETHLSYTLGLKIELTMPNPTGGNVRSLAWTVGKDRRTATVTAEAQSRDGRFRSRTAATIGVNPQTGWYEWSLTTSMTSLADKPVTLAGVEFNNIYPGKAGRCMLFAPEKEYHCTLMVDRDGVVWEFPHQHMMHYGQKISQLRFAEGSVAGFFGEQEGSPVCVVHEATMEPDWGICDMYYDLHCCGRPAGPILPGEEHRWRYTVKYLTPVQTRPLIQAARPVPVTAADWEQHTYPRLELGMNHFDSPVRIDRMDDASGFRERPPRLVWDHDVGHKLKGALRLANDQDAECVWSAEPPTQIPAESEFRLVGLVMTKGVTGKGIYLRVRYHTFDWFPQPHVDWTQTLCSTPVNGTTDGWVRVEVPALKVPERDFDYLIWIDVVLEGKGTAWLTDVDVDLVRVRAGVPVDV